MSIGAHVAYHDDPAIKAALLERIDAANASDLRERTTGSANAKSESVAAIWSDPKELGSATGFPPSLIVLLARIGYDKALVPGASGDFARCWFADTPVGADLSSLPARLALWMLNDPEAVVRPDSIGAHIRALHMREAEGEAPERRDWSSARANVLALAQADGTAEGSADVLRHALWEAAAWSAGTSISTLSDMAAPWVHLSGSSMDPNWSQEDELRKETILRGFWDEFAPAREAGDDVDYPALFQAHDAELERRFVAHLVLVNTATRRRWDLLASKALDFLASETPLVASR